jgi:hypothetical protein
LRQELKKLLVSAALEALGDVGHDGHRSPTHLFPELTVPEESRIRRDLVDRSCQGASRLPDIQLFKTVDGSQADPLLKIVLTGMGSPARLGPWTLGLGLWTRVGEGWEGRAPPAC